MDPYIEGLALIHHQIPIWGNNTVSMSYIEHVRCDVLVHHESKFFPRLYKKNSFKV